MELKLKAFAIATFASVALVAPPAAASSVTTPVLAQTAGESIGEALCVIFDIATVGLTDVSCGDGGSNSETVSNKGSKKPKPIPTPALLPGLIGMGIAAVRKRNSASSEND